MAAEYVLVYLCKTKKIIETFNTCNKTKIYLNEIKSNPIISIKKPNNVTVSGGRK